MAGMIGKESRIRMKNQEQNEEFQKNDEAARPSSQ